MTVVIVIVVIVTVLIVTVLIETVVIVTVVIVAVVIVTSLSKNNMTHGQTMRCSKGSVLRFSRCFLKILNNEKISYYD